MLGTRLTQLRKSKKLRQEDIATKLGIARTTYAMYEQEKREPDFVTLQKLADLFEVTTDYLLGRTGASISTPSELSSEEKLVLNEIKKYPILFHDLANAPEKKIKQLIKMWEFIKKDLNEDDEEPEDIIEE